MIYIINLIFNALFLSYAAPELIIQDFGMADCRQFKEIGKATGQLVEIRQWSGMLIEDKKNLGSVFIQNEGSCELWLDETKLQETDQKFIGFGNSKVFIIKSPNRVKFIRLLVGSEGKLKSKKSFKYTSLNEKQFETPALRIDCTININTCEILISKP